MVLQSSVRRCWNHCISVAVFNVWKGQLVSDQGFVIELFG